MPQVDLNLKSIFLTCKYVLPVMEGQGGGAIVNTASASGLRYTGAAQVAYAACKAGADPVLQGGRGAVRRRSRFASTRWCPRQLHTPDGRSAAGEGPCWRRR